MEIMVLLVFFGFHSISGDSDNHKR